MMINAVNPPDPSAPMNCTPNGQMHASTMMALAKWRPGSNSGLLPIEPRSLPNAIIDPVKVTPPMNTPSRISI